MGEAAEDLIESCMIGDSMRGFGPTIGADYDIDKRRPLQGKRDLKPKPVRELWRTRDGKLLRVCDMTDTHLNNSITMLERNNRRAGLKVLYRERTYRDSKKCHICGHEAPNVQCPECAP